MTQKCYRVQFTAHLHKLTLALKMKCEIQVIWKRGQKKCQSGKVVLAGGEAVFDRNISICCSMVFDKKTKIFQQKITKFSIILVSQKGVKQAGQIQFNLAEYINQRQLAKKQYEEKLTGCPDKNAKLSFSLTGVLKEQIAMDQRSELPQIKDQSPISIQKKQQKTAPLSKIQVSGNKVAQQLIPEKDIPAQNKQKNDSKAQKIKILQQQNRKIKQQLKAAQKLKQENDQYRRKLKGQDFNKATQIKQKIEKHKKQVQKIKAEIRANKRIQDQTLQIQKDIFKCKVKIMKAFNYASQYGGSQLVDAIHNSCGYQQK